MQDILDMDRRGLMKNIALLLGAASIPTLAACKGAMTGAGALSDEQLKVLTAIADTIIPATDTGGALAVGVPKMLSGMIAEWASAETRAELVGAIDEIAKLGGGKPFTELDPAGRTALLTEHDKAAVQPGPPPKKKPTGLEAMMGGAPTMNPAYVKLKGLIIDLYYTSELASTKELIYEHVPGKFVASFKITPETRPFAGTGGPF